MVKVFIFSPSIALIPFAVLKSSSLKYMLYFAKYPSIFLPSSYRVALVSRHSSLKLISPATLEGGRINGLPLKRSSTTGLNFERGAKFWEKQTKDTRLNAIVKRWANSCSIRLLKSLFDFIFLYCKIIILV